MTAGWTLQPTIQMWSAQDESRVAIIAPQSLGVVFVASWGPVDTAQATMSGWRPSTSGAGPVRAAVACGFDMIAAGSTFGSRLGIRIGIDHGPVAAGIMGKTQFQFDVWGDTVNTAARIEGAARPGSVCVSGRAWMHLRHRADGRSLGLVDLKGKQKIEIVECVALKE